MTYSIVFEVKQLEIVLNSLANSPYNVVSPTIESVKAQIYQQNQPAGHSSATGIYFTYLGKSYAVYNYDYGKNDDLYLKWYSDLSSHRIVAYSWARSATEAASGSLAMVWSSSNETVRTPMGYDGSALKRYQLDIIVSSGDSTILSLEISSRTNTTVNYVDDVLTSVDVIDLNPDFNTMELDAKDKIQGNTLSGRFYTYEKYNRNRWMLPLQYLPEDDKNKINWWWRNKFNVMFTMSQSDTTDMFVCQIVNAQQLISTRNEPYHDLWSGTLDLEEVSKSLVF